ncbi:MAG: TIGR03792 family protein [Elainellaceae cyanobacterium]
MVIEWLKFWVDESNRERFVQIDDDIWTQALAQYPGFLGKDIWISHESRTEVIAVIRWETEDAWDSIPRDDLDNFEARFLAAMGPGTYDLRGSKKYFLRKSSRG